uniref:CUB domain-containing protein n=1 Tax=Strigamia maritima TaxID=126957 RepID=T1J427_STRMM
MAFFLLIITFPILLFNLNNVKCQNSTSKMATLTCQSPAVELSTPISEFVWIIDEKDDFHLDILLKKVNLNNDCGSLFIGPGRNPASDEGVLLTNPQEVRVAQPLAFIQLKNLGAGGSVQFEVKCWRSRMPAKPLEPVPTRFIPLKNDISVDACLKNIDNEALHEFMKGESILEKRFEEKVTKECIKRLKMEDECWQPQEDQLLTHINWPLFIERSDKTDENSLFVVCFKVTVKLSSSRNCTIQISELEIIVRNLGGIMDKIVVTVIDEKTDFFALVAFGIAIFTLTTALFTVVWYKQRQAALLSMSQKKSVQGPQKSTWLEIAPVKRVNPVHGIELELDDFDDDDDDDDDSVFENGSERSSVQKPDWEEYCTKFGMEQEAKAGPSSENTYDQSEDLDEEVVSRRPTTIIEGATSGNVFNTLIEQAQQFQEQQLKQGEQQKQQLKKEEQQQQLELLAKEKEEEKLLELQEQQKTEKKQQLLEQLKQCEEKQHEEEQKQHVHEEEQKQHEEEQKQHEEEQKQQEDEQKQHEEEQKQEPKQQEEFELDSAQVLTKTRNLIRKSSSAKKKDNVVHFNTNVECLIFDTTDDDVETYL